MSKLISCKILFLLAISLVTIANTTDADDITPLAKVESPATVDLLKSETYEQNWKNTNFGGEGDVSLKDGVLTLKSGTPMTGITYENEDFPKENYEVQWSARRVKGNDFFSCVTFPVGNEFCSVVCGGWGGGVVGLSSINGSDAVENETTQYINFENDKWYKLTLKVTPELIEFWIDGANLIDVKREDKSFSTRIEVLRSRPFGFCNYQCVSELKDFHYQDLSVNSNAIGKDANKNKAATKERPPKFFRVKNDDNDSAEAMQTAVATYIIDKGPFAGAKIDLIGAVHVGEASYYKQLDKLFESYEALLFELVADPEIRLAGRKDQEGVINPISSMQVAMKDALELDFQLDRINYDAANFVHADMTPQEFLDDMAKRKDNFVNMFARVLGSSIAVQSSGGGGQEAAMLAAMVSPNRAMALRRLFALQMEQSEAQMAGIADENGFSTLVTERNNKALSVLRRELTNGKRKLGIFYGAAHLDDMHRKLIDEFDARLDHLQWMTAWALQ